VQTGFFMLADDEASFLQMVLDRGDSGIVEGRFFEQQRPALVGAVGDLGSASDLVLVNRRLMPVPACSGRGAGEMDGRFLFESYVDPTVEMNRSQMLGDVLVAGRLHCHDLRLSRDADAAAIHGKWYRALASWLTRRSVKYHGLWVAPAAADWSLNGGRLAFGSPVERVAVRSMADAPSSEPG